jgi:hypothetical protein
MGNICCLYGKSEYRLGSIVKKRGGKGGIFYERDSLTRLGRPPDGFIRQIHCKKSVLKIQEYIHEGANLMFYIPELLIPEFTYIEVLVPNCRIPFFTVCRKILIIDFIAIFIFYN